MLLELGVRGVAGGTCAIIGVMVTLLRAYLSVSTRHLSVSTRHLPVSTQHAGTAHALSVRVDTDFRVSTCAVVAARSAASAVGLSKEKISPPPMRKVWTAWI